MMKVVVLLTLLSGSAAWAPPTALVRSDVRPHVRISPTALRLQNPLSPPEEDTVDSFTKRTMAASEQGSDLAKAGSVSFGTAAFAFGALGVFSLVTYLLQESLNGELYFKMDEVCKQSWEAAQGTDPIEVPNDKCLEYFSSKFFDVEANEAWTKVLMWTHAFPFLFIPITMKIVTEKAETIQKDFPDFNPFVMNLGLATVIFGLAQEFGWHVTSSWYYVNNFHILNFGFYFFLISGFALWADGFGTNSDPIFSEGGLNWKSSQWDAIFGLILLAATILYPIGAAGAIGQPDAGSEFKIPLYIGLTVTFLVLSFRGLEVFGNKFWAVPFFSVGVNLMFIALLGGETANYTDMNYIYHICHDLLGTELGVIIFALYVNGYNGLPESDES